MSLSFHSRVSGLGAYIPEKVLTNHDLEKIVDTTDEWIRTRTGISERHIAAEGQVTSDLALEASKQAMNQAGITVKDLDLIIVATITPDMVFPSTACRLQHKLGASCGAFDLAAACSGFPYALTVADAFVRGGIYQNILVLGAEVLSGFINWKDRSTCVLFGDGAGAAVITRAEEGSDHRIIRSQLGSDGGCGDILMLPGGGSCHPPSEKTVREGLHFLKMEGSELFKVAVRTMEQAVLDVLKEAGLELKDIHYLIPHQANSRILSAVQDRLQLPDEKVYINVDRYGNMSSASTIVAFHEAVRDEKIKKGDNVVLVAFGGGLTWASTLIQW